MEKGHLHHGINARPEAAFAGDLCRVDHVKTRFFLIQGGLGLPRGRRDQTSSALYGVLSRKMPPGFSRSAIWYLSINCSWWQPTKSACEIRYDERIGFSLTRRCETVRPPAFFES